MPLAASDRGASTPKGPSNTERPGENAQSDDRKPTRRVDAETVARAIRGERDATHTVLVAYSDFIRGVLYRLMGANQDIDDLQQTVMLRIFEHIDSLRSEAALTTWVAGICVNAVRDHYRRRKVHGVVIPVGGPTDFVHGAPSHGEQSLQARERLRWGWQALGRLSHKHRTTYVLRHVYGYSIEEIAEIMGAMISTTRMRLYHGKRALAKALAAAQQSREREEAGDA